jgi:hypothetical protein
MISSKVLVPIVIGIACLLALTLGSNLAVDSGQTMVYACFGAMVVLLIAFAREYWWLAMFLAVGFGGYAYFGFRIYAHEALFALAIAGLLPSIALSPRSEFVHTRPKLPWFFYAALAYLCLHVVYSITENGARGFIEYGNICRAYAFGIWPLLFILAFRLYGRAEHLPAALYLLQIVYLIRAVMTLATVYFPKAAMVLPGINFVLPGNATNAGGLDDLRFAGHGICVLATALLLGRPPTLHGRVWQVMLLVFSMAVLLMGGGRVMIVASILSLFAAMLAGRMWKMLTATGVCAIAAVIFVNLFPSSIYIFDKRVQRTLTILILDKQSTEVRSHTAASDIWHERLQEIGFERWTSSPRHFLLGTGIIPWDPTITRESNWTLRVEATLQGAANTASYESALWTILTPTGLVGLTLYLLTIGYFAVGNGKQLCRGNLSGYAKTAAFLGTYAPLEWLLFSPRSGGYPSIELLLAVTAFYYLNDRKVLGLRSSPSAQDEFSPYAEELRT